MNSKLPLVFILFLWYCQDGISQIPLQTIRGKVSDASTGRPLPGASVQLPGTQPLLGTTANEDGTYRLEQVPVGRYRLQVSFVGFETVVVAELLVEAGKEAVQDVLLEQRGEALGEVVVKAAGTAPLQTPGTQVLSVEEQFRFPATFFDPVRLAMYYPGVVGENDGTNIVSVRGNSPNAVRWRLEGVDIVNPNHTANAGTFSDRPTQAAGGVNILSAQLLGVSRFLTGAFPAECGNALGGILDMRLRSGNNRRHEFTTQAGFLGIEAAAEGPLFTGSNLTGGSFLANYRYSFTGLLTSFGVDFGNETTRFQDLSFHLTLPAGKAGQFTVLGMGGTSGTSFRSPGDSTTFKEDKERFDIDFESAMFAAGLTHTLPLGEKSALRSVAVVSALKHRRSALLAENPAEKIPWEDDDNRERKTALSSVFFYKPAARHRLKAGIQASQEWAVAEVFFTSVFLINFNARVSAWLLQPFCEWQVKLSPKVEFNAGFRWSYFTYRGRHSSPEPRLWLAYAPNAHQRLSLAYGLLSQTQLAQVYQSAAASGKRLGFTRSQQVVAGYRREFPSSLVFNAEAYFQYLWHVPVFPESTRSFSVLNLTDFSVAYLAGAPQNALGTLTPAGAGRNYGIDLSLQKFILDHYYFLFSGSLYHSEYTAAGHGVWRPTRFDGRHALNLSGGREFFKQKEKKVIVKGVNARLAWLGGFRDTPVDTAGSSQAGYTVYREQKAFSQKLPGYFRIDLRLYLKWSETGRNCLLSLDVQNVTNRRNVAYRYFDNVQQKVATRRQLGLIPVLSYRMAF